MIEVTFLKNEILYIYHRSNIYSLPSNQTGALRHAFCKHFIASWYKTFIHFYEFFIV